MKKLARSIEVYKGINNPQWIEGCVIGKIKVNNFLNSFVEDYEDDLEIELEDDSGVIISRDNLSQYDKIKIKFFPPRKEYSFFAKDFDDYLENFGFLYSCPDEFYISDIDGLYQHKASSNELIQAYCEIIDWYKILLRLADHTEKIDGKSHKHILLSVSGKEELTVIYGINDIRRIKELHSDFQASSIADEVFAPPHQSAKTSLLKKSMFQILSGNKEEEKFSIFIDRLPDVLNSYRNNYELFINEFSFEDEKEKLDKSKQEYVLKLNEILSGIHGKLLAVPVSLVLVAGQMKSSSVENYTIINVIILAGAFLFALLMWMLTANQLHSLKAVKTDFESKRNRLQVELRSSLYTELSEAFKQLGRRFTHQRNVIRVVDFLVLLGLLFSLFIFEYHTTFLANFL